MNKFRMMALSCGAALMAGIVGAGSVAFAIDNPGTVAITTAMTDLSAQWATVAGAAIPVGLAVFGTLWLVRKGKSAVR